MSSWFKPSTGYEQVKLVEAARKQLEPLLLESRPVAPQIAITWSDHARAMIESEPMDKDEDVPSEHQGVVEFWHRLVFEHGFHRDVRFEGASLDGLKLLITPAMPYVSEAFLQRVIDFVTAGGVWLIGPGTGLRDREHTVPTRAGMGMLDAVAGVETQYVFPLTQTGITGTVGNSTLSFTGWCAAVKATHTDTKVLGTFNSNLVPGTAFLTERALGSGKVVLLSAHPMGDEGKAFIANLIQEYAEGLQIAKLPEATHGTMVCPHVNRQGGSLWVIINMDGKGGSVKLGKNTRDAVSGKSISGGSLELGAYEWRALVADAG